MLDCMADKASLLAIKNQSRKAWCLKELSWNLLPAECRQIPHCRDSFHFHLLLAEDWWKVFYEKKMYWLLIRTQYIHTSSHKCFTEAAYSQTFLSSSVQVSGELVWSLMLSSTFVLLSCFSKYNYLQVHKANSEQIQVKLTILKIKSSLGLEGEFSSLIKLKEKKMQRTVLLAR